MRTHLRKASYAVILLGSTRRADFVQSLQSFASCASEVRKLRKNAKWLAGCLSRLADGQTHIARSSVDPWFAQSPGRKVHKDPYCHTTATLVIRGLRGVYSVPGI